MQQHDSHRLDPGVEKGTPDGSNLVLVECGQHLAGRQHAFSNRKRQTARDQRLRRIEIEVERADAAVTPKVENVTKPIGDEQRRRRPSPLHHCVGDERRRVDEAVGRRQRARFLRAQPTQTVEHGLGGIVGCGGHLLDADLTGRLVVQHDVGERPPDVGPDHPRTTHAVLSIAVLHPRPQRPLLVSFDIRY